MMGRREFLSAGIVAGFAGCTQENAEETPILLSADPETRTVTPQEETRDRRRSHYEFSDPYEAVDWNTYGRHKGQFHVHPHYGDRPSTPQEVYDHYVGLGYDVINVQPKSDLSRGMAWPLEEMGEQNEDWENRYPARDGVVALPGAEYADSQHVTGFFTELMQERIQAAISSGSMFNLSYQRDTVEQILLSEPTPGTVEPLAFVAHPGRYKDSDRAWNEEQLDHYRRLLDEFPNCLGLEAITYQFGYDDRDLWDQLLGHAASDRPVMGTSVDDISYLEEADRGWVTFYLSGDEFDPADQRATRESVYDAWVSGRTSFSTASEPGLEAPLIESIERDEGAGTITIEANGHDVIEWVSHGDVIETDETLEYAGNDAVGSYVRAQLVEGDPDDPVTITCTQAWPFDGE